MKFGPVERLTSQHDRTAFDCGDEAQTRFLREFARQYDRNGMAVTYVVCEEDTPTVIGYYSVTMAEISRDIATDEVLRRTPNYPIPAVLLSRLGVDLKAQGRGLGHALVKDAMQRAAATAEEVGCRAFLVHAAHQEIRDNFYIRDFDFDESQTHPLHLMLPMNDITTRILGS